ncbi:hypothetical protein WMY93_015559 [Mugilogobius chulae]|uniref:A-kinase anchor protein 7-like phosphoesterase domain-containing protein n=1 Tax=Mugilogobius chulae TaxID=88201 RepID=A0AAW0NRK3_9GOBI
MAVLELVTSQIDLLERERGSPYVRSRNQVYASNSVATCSVTNCATNEGSADSENSHSGQSYFSYLSGLFPRRQGSVTATQPKHNINPMTKVPIASVTYKMVVSGKTLGAHLEIIQRINGLVSEQAFCLQLQETKEEDSQVIIVFCPVVSRVGTDIDAALQGLSSNNKPVIVVAMHHMHTPTGLPPPRTRNQLSFFKPHTQCLHYITESKILCKFGFSCSFPKVSMSLLEEIRRIDWETARQLEMAGCCTDQDFRSLTQNDLQDLLPGFSKFRLRKRISEVIHKHHPISAVLNELKGFIPDEFLRDAFSSNGALQDYLQLLKSLKREVNHVQEFLDAHIELLEKFSHKREATNHTKVPRVTRPSSNATTAYCFEHDSHKYKTQTSPVTSRYYNYSKPASVKYNMRVSGNTLGRHNDILEKLKSNGSDSVYLQEVNGDEDSQFTIVFCPVVSRAGSDAETALHSIPDDEPVILVMMHHCRNPIAAPAIQVSDHNVVLRNCTYVRSFQKFITAHKHEDLKLQPFTAATSLCKTLTTHRLGLKANPFVLGMLPAACVTSKDMTALPTEEDDEEEDAAAVVDQKCQTKGLKEKKSRRKMWREKKKLKKNNKSDEAPDTLMSELPFALASPTSWKELGFTNTDPKQKKRKRGEIGGRADSEEDAGEKKKKKESKRPNYFVSIRITNPQISSAVAEVQQAVLQQEPKLSKAMIPIPTLHITLLVTHLANQEQVDLAATVLAAVEPSLAELLGGRVLVLPFSGIGHFRKEVVFIGLAPGEHRHTLDSLAELLRSRFEEQGLLQGDCRGFEPHLTIMKLSRASKLRAQGIKRVDPSLYSDYTERVDLCSMLKKKQQDGYYHTETSLQLDLWQELRVKDRLQCVFSFFHQLLSCNVAVM